MIPKIIHYCWYGGTPLPKLARQCIASWKRFCPDYQIIEWNEDNSPISLYPFAEAAMNSKKWAFVSDVIRLHVLKTYGGIYMDTDVELLKSFDDLLFHKNFTGYERDSNNLQTAVFASEANNQWISDCLDIYKNLNFSSERIAMSSLVNNRLISQLLLERGIKLDGSTFIGEYITIYPHDYFCPMSYETHFIEITDNTYCLHYYTFSWSEPETIKGKFKNILVRFMGEKMFRRIVNYIRGTK